MIKVVVTREIADLNEYGLDYIKEMKKLALRTGQLISHTNGLCKVKINNKVYLIHKKFLKEVE